MENKMNPIQDENPAAVTENLRRISDDISQIKDNLAYLNDLYVRRLNDDKQKRGIIQTLTEGASYSFVEPFLHDIILLLDRLEKSDDDFVKSAAEELYDIINRRGVERIPESPHFNPILHRAVKAVDDPDASENYIAGIVRKGYIFSGKVLRPTEVIVGRPAVNPNKKEGM